MTYTKAYSNACIVLEDGDVLFKNAKVRLTWDDKHGWYGKVLRYFDMEFCGSGPTGVFAVSGNQGLTLSLSLKVLVRQVCPISEVVNQIASSVANDAGVVAKLVWFAEVKGCTMWVHSVESGGSAKLLTSFVISDEDDTNYAVFVSVIPTDKMRLAGNWIGLGFSNSEADCAAVVIPDLRDEELDGAHFVALYDLWDTSRFKKGDCSVGGIQVGVNGYFGKPVYLADKWSRTPSQNGPWGVAFEYDCESDVATDMVMCGPYQRYKFSWWQERGTGVPIIRFATIPVTIQDGDLLFLSVRSIREDGTKDEWGVYSDDVQDNHLEEELRNPNDVHEYAVEVESSVMDKGLERIGDSCFVDIQEVLLFHSKGCVEVLSTDRQYVKIDKFVQYWTLIEGEEMTILRETKRAVKE